MAFSATDAALEGFRITRAHPKAVLAWAVVQLVLAVLMNATARIVAGPALERFSTLSAITAKDFPAEVEQLAPMVMGMLAIALLLLVCFYAVLYSAVNRAVMKPQAGWDGWLRLGLDELRQGLVLLGFGLALLGAYFGGALAVRALGGLLGLILGPVGSALGVVLGLPAVLALVIWVGVRLSLAPPATFASGRVTLFGAWSLTRGCFWPLLGAYAVSWLLYLLVWVLVQALSLPLIAVMPGLDALSGAKGTLSSLAVFADPAFLIGLVFSALGGGLTTAVILAPAPFAYRELTAAPRQVDAFV